MNDGMRVVPRRVLSQEEVSAILVGGYKPETGEIVPGILWDFQAFHRAIKIFGAVITTLLVPIAVESIVHLWFK
jgi:hypothetical protein